MHVSMNSMMYTIFTTLSVEILNKDFQFKCVKVLNCFVFEGFFLKEVLNCFLDLIVLSLYYTILC